MARDAAAYDDLFKIVLVGDAGVGKTNVLAYFASCEDEEDDSRLASAGAAKTPAPSFSAARKPTVGVEFASKTLTTPDGTRIRVQIWDTAGQERFRAITTAHYRRAAGALLVYDVTSKASFRHALDGWLDELKQSSDPDAGVLNCTMLVGNKIDLEDASGEGVTLAEHEAACRKYGLLSGRTSAKTGENVNRAFRKLIVAVHEDTVARSAAAEVPSANGIKLGGVQGGESGAKSAMQSVDQCCA